MSTVGERRLRRIKQDRLHRQLDRTLECALSMAYSVSGMPDIRAQVDDMLDSLRLRTRRPLRLTRSHL